VKLKAFGKGGEYKKQPDLLEPIFGILMERGILRCETKLDKFGVINYFVPGGEIDSEIESVIVNDSIKQLRGAMSEDDIPLLRDLANVRHQLSIEEHCSASDIISTPSLLGMAMRKPETPEEMILWAGVPAVQAERYGRFFADAVLRHFAAAELKCIELSLASPS
jgi:superfamily II DNA helicase RecQ